MKYDFTSILERAHHDAIAVDLPTDYLGGFAGHTRKEGFDVIPMWVADMNFPACPTIQDAVIERVKHPAFGYFRPREEYFNKIIKWHETRNHVTDLKAEYIGYENGVLGGVVSAMKVLASMGDNVLVHAPTYVGFTHALENNGYNMVHSSMYKDENNVWRMDFEDMEKKIVENRIHVAIMCNPHNPCGRVWSKEELKQAADIFEKHQVWIIEDCIWSDLILEDNVYTPMTSVSAYAKEHTVTLYAPSKTFNLAGLIGSYHIIYNKWLKDRIDKESSLCHYNSMNVLSMYALLGAYEPEGYEWLDELKEVLAGNVNYACDFINNKLEGVKVSKPEGTYMLFVDCKEYCEAHNTDVKELLRRAYEVGVYVQDGAQFRDPFSIRMNLALPLSRVKEAFDRLDQYVFTK